MEIIYFILAIAFFLIQVVIIRWALRINTLVKALWAMLSIQAQQAKNQGIDPDQIRIIMDIIYGKGRDPQLKNTVG